MFSSTKLFGERLGRGAGIAAVVAVLVGVGGPPPTVTAADEVPAQIVADQIRRQGYRCENPVVATRDTKESQVHSVVWILDCNGVRYSVRLVPDQAAKVEKLSK